jgi:hypothetical protein
LRSNSIEIWYTSELEVKGTPLMSHGIVDGLVLKVVRNGNYGLIATDIQEVKKKDANPLCLMTWESRWMPLITGTW